MLTARRASFALLATLALLFGFVTPAQASTTATVRVTLLDPQGVPFSIGAEGEALRVWLGPTSGAFPIEVPMNADGTGQAVVPTGTYQVEVSYTGRQNVLNGWGGSTSTRVGAMIHTVTAGIENEIVEQLRAGGTITGSVTGDGFELDYASFGVYPQGGTAASTSHVAWFDVETQQYTITRLRPTTYNLLVRGSATGQPQLVSEWIGGVLAAPAIAGVGTGGDWPRLGQTVVVTNGSHFSAPALSLEVMSKITGVVSWPGTEPDWLSKWVVAYLDGVKVGEVRMSGEGVYTLRDVARYDGDEWVVCIAASYSWNNYSWAESCWSPTGAVARSHAASVSAVDNATVSGIDIDAVAGRRLGYTVSYDLDGPGGASPQFAHRAMAYLYRLSADGERFDYIPIGGFPGPPAASQSTPPLMPGTYAVQFIDLDRPQLGRTWLTPAGATTTAFSEQNLIEVVAGNMVYQDVVLRPFVRTFDRLSGSDRFATAVEVSRATIGDDEVPANVVYVANGLNYPDALSAGPIAAQQGGALLLVSPNSIPDSVRDELTRLRPERIVIVGGTGAVSASVQTQLRQFVDNNPLRVSRVSGDDRYIVSRALIADAFSGETGMPIFIATGLNYPDALAAGPAAAALGGAVLLVNGSASTIDAATRQLLDTLQPSAVVLVGGSAVVSNGIETALRLRYGGSDRVFRLAGNDRYSGAAQLNAAVFEESSISFLATGTSFADALAGGALAGQLGVPLYLTQPQCIPPIAHQGMTLLRSSHAVILGGTGAVSAAVERGAVCGIQSSEAPISVTAPGSVAERLARQDIERFREAVGIP